MIKVSISCATYNHKDFIRKCLEGFVMQKTNFEFEVLIHDDASTDGTTEIIKEYEKKYPHIIKPIYQTENQLSQKKTVTERFNLPRAQGKYFAFCEGDDYWTDENKLQTQVDFLDNNPDFSGCFHKSLRKNIITGEDICFKPSVEELNGKDVFTIHETLSAYFIETCSAMYRWDIYKEELLNLYPKDITNMDSYYIYFFSLKGKIKYIDKLMSVKTINNSGIWNSL